MRNWIKKCSAILAAALVLSLVVPAIVPAAGVVKAEAAEVKLSDKKVKLEVGETHQLELEGTESNAKWKSKKSKVASVDKNGVITAKKEGKTTIIATVYGQKYKCKVTVVRAENPYVAEAPFEAEEYYNKDAGYSMAVPKGWLYGSEDGMDAFMPSEDTTIVLAATCTTDENFSKETYGLFKAFVEYTYTEDAIATYFDGMAVVGEKGVQVRELENDDNKVAVVECDLVSVEDESPVKYIYYALVTKGASYEMEVIALDEYEGEISLVETVDYMIQSFQYYK